MSRVLVTGATGFIGRGALAPLLASGMEVHAVSSQPPKPTAARDGAADSAPLTAVHWHRADLLSEASAEPLVERVAPTHLLHLAWYAEPGAFWCSTENLRWVEATLRLLRAFARHAGRRAVVAGTCAEYAWKERTVCVEGVTPCHPATLYGASKHGLRLIAERFAQEVGMSLGWGRVFFVYGPGEDPRRLGGSVARALVLGEEAPCSHGEQLRDFLYSHDLAAAFVALLCSSVEGPVNLASGSPIRLRDLIEALAVAAGRLDLVRLGARPAPAGEPDELVADVTRLREEVGWIPSATLEQRAADTIRWWSDALSAGALPQGAA